MQRSKLNLLVMAVLLASALFLSLALPMIAAAQAPVGITDTPTPTPTATFTPTPIISPQGPPVVPEASTVILLGSAASGLAGYVGLQIRARRHRS